MRYFGDFFLKNRFWLTDCGCSFVNDLRCRPTETGAGPSDARIAAAAPYSTGVFLACAWCLELSRNLRIACCVRHRHALRTRVSAPQARAHCLLACPASSCSVITATAVQPSSAAHCGIGRTETRV